MAVAVKCRKLFSSDLCLFMYNLLAVKTMILLVCLHLIFKNCSNIFISRFSLERKKKLPVVIWDPYQEVNVPSPQFVSFCLCGTFPNLLSDAWMNLMSTWYSLNLNYVSHSDLYKLVNHWVVTCICLDLKQL